MKALKNIDMARVKFREIDCDTKLKKVMSEKINPNVEKHYTIGDPVFFHDVKKKEWKKGTILVRLGKTVYLRFGNFLRRVPVEKVRPDYNGEVNREEGYAENDGEEDRFAAEETPVREMAKDLELAEENNELRKQFLDLQEKFEEKIKETEAITQAVTNARTNKEQAENKGETEKINVLEARKLKRKNQKKKIEEEKLMAPITGQKIVFKEKGSDVWKSGRVVGGHKKTSKHKYLKHIQLGDDFIIERDFINGIDEWKEESENDVEATNEDVAETYVMTDIIDEGVFPVKIIYPKEYHRPEIQNAIAA